MSYVDKKDYYEYKKPEKEAQTRKRLQELYDLGMKELGTAAFGIPNVISGIYIERVWSHDEKEWNDYVAWMKEVIANKSLL